MGDADVPYPGQRWRSLIDGHTVVVGCGVGDGLWIRYDGTNFATAIDPATFSDDYVFVEAVQSSTADAVAG